MLHRHYKEPIQQQRGMRRCGKRHKERANKQTFAATYNAVWPIKRTKIFDNAQTTRFRGRQSVFSAHLCEQTADNQVASSINMAQDKIALKQAQIPINFAANGIVRNSWYQRLYDAIRWSEKRREPVQSQSQTREDTQPRYRDETTPKLSTYINGRSRKRA